MFKLVTSLVVGGLIILSPMGTITAQSEFNIKVFNAEDVNPPTAPVLTSVDPVASSQIDLDWTASTDNFSVSGYVVTRDGTDIATTSLTSYSDTGLTPTTTYSYNVRAFDNALNYSSSSNTIATTTLAIFVPATPSSVQSNIGRVVMRDLEVFTGWSTSSLRFNTAMPARTEVRWGRTSNYELGYVVGSVFKRQHIFNLADLEPDTDYSYEVVGITPSGHEQILITDSFTTKSKDGTIDPPANVSRLQAVKDESDVRLSWQNPDREFDYIRVVRSHLGFPVDANDGAVVYQGRGESFVDQDILEQYSPVYYTVFVYGVDGRLSSGAVVMVNELELGVTSLPPISPEPKQEIDQERIPAEMLMPDLSDFSIIQGGQRFTLLDHDIKLSSHDDFVVVLPVELVADNLKSIILTVLDPTDNRKAYSFLMRLNNNRTAYVATVSPLNVLGSSQLQIEVYDYQAFMVATYQSPTEFVSIDKLDLAHSIKEPESNLIEYLLGVGGLFLLLLIWLIIYRRVN